MENQKVITVTSFQLPITLHDEMKIMCALTHKSMGEFIRISIRDKIKELHRNTK